MPIYTVQLDSGQIIDIEGPSGASEAQLKQVADNYLAVAKSPNRPDIPSDSPGMMETAKGGAEALATMGTAATTGTMGYVGGLLKGLAEEVIAGNYGNLEANRRIQQSAMEGMQNLTYEPKTETGKEIVQTVGETLEPLAAVGPLGAELTAISSAVRPTAQVARAGLQPAIDKLQTGVKPIGDKVKNAVSPIESDRSMGAAQLGEGELRQQLVDELPVSFNLTKGQKTRDFDDIKFERETAKLEEGAGLRDRFAEQNLKLQQNIDAFIDSTGAEVTDLRDIGLIVDKALKTRYNSDKKKVRALYKKAENAGETKEKVNVDNLIALLNDSESAESTAPILKAAKNELIRLGGARIDEEGKLVPVSVFGSISIDDAEQIIKFINANSSFDGPDTYYSPLLKKSIDEATEDKGGKLYKAARKARRQMAKDYENDTVINNLIKTKKGTDERKIAFENVLNKIVLDATTSQDSMRKIKRLLMTKDREGQGAQAWKEIQGGVLRHLKDEMTRNMQIDQSGNRVVSPAALDRSIKKLDTGGKLDYIFGKKGAEQVRLVNEVAQDVLVSPPGAINHSNTATALAALLDLTMASTTGLPAPVASGLKLLMDQVKSKKLKVRIKKHLGETKGEAMKRRAANNLQG